MLCRAQFLVPQYTVSNPQLLKIVQVVVGVEKALIQQTDFKSKMHSSRMRTIRCSGRLCVCGEGGDLPRGVVWDVCLGGMSAQGVCPGEGGVSAQGGCLPRGVSARVVSARVVSARVVSARGVSA